MRKITNTIATINDQTSLTYGELIMSCVKVPSNQQLGLNYDELKKIGRIDSIVGEDKLKPEFIFEEADYNFIKDKLSKMNWAFYHKEFITFTDYVNSVPEFKIETATNE